MTLSRNQIVTIGFFLLVLAVLASFRTKPKELLERERNRSMNLLSTNVNILIQEAAPLLSSNSKTKIQLLEAELAEEGISAEDKAELNRRLSSTWYEAGQIGIAGHFAEEVAKITEDASSWGISGTTYGLCIKRTEKEKEREYCLTKSLEALENAISLDPENLDFQINRAVILAENPPKDNPMRGVLLLLDMNKKFPKNVPVINNIAKFALQTNQLERAEQRLLGALSIEPDNVMTNCLLAQLYSIKGDESRSLTYEQKCATK